MNRSVLATVLSRAEGIETDGNSHVVKDEHHVSFYVGQPGQAMVIAEVERCALEEEYLEITTRESHTTVYVEYDAIHAVARRPPKEEERRRAGF